MKKLLALLSIFLLIHISLADELFEDDLFEKEEIGEKLGFIAAFFLLIGFVHPATKFAERFFRLKSPIKDLTRKSHCPAMFLATLTAVIHHSLSESSLSGYIPLILMLTLSFTGFLLKFSTPSKRFFRTLHFQRSLSLILIISIFIHAA